MELLLPATFLVVVIIAEILKQLQTLQRVKVNFSRTDATMGSGN